LKHLSTKEKESTESFKVVANEMRSSQKKSEDTEEVRKKEKPEKKSM